MNERTEKIEGLMCHIVDALPEGASPKFVVILCHGFGAPGTDLVPLGYRLLRQPKIAGAVQFIFPEAPLSLEAMGAPDGRAWWLLDVRRLQMANALGTFSEFRNDCPNGLTTVRQLLQDVIKHWSAKTGLPISRFVLGGFSQGSMLATDVTLQLDENTAGLLVLSGTLISEDVWRDRATHHKTLRVIQSHGQYDQILPLAAAGWLRDLLNAAGADVEFLPFNGGHEIPSMVLDHIETFLKETIGDGRNKA
jgi:phospholipase/carboxylesterase